MADAGETWHAVLDICTPLKVSEATGWDSAEYQHAGTGKIPERTPYSTSFLAAWFSDSDAHCGVEAQCMGTDAASSIGTVTAHVQ